MIKGEIKYNFNYEFNKRQPKMRLYLLFSLLNLGMKN